MRRTNFALVFALLAAVGGCGSSTSAPTIVTLQNDAFAGGSPAFTSGFVAGERAAAVFPPRNSSFVVRTVTFLFGGATTASTVTLSLYSDDGTLPVGTPLYSADYALTPSDASFQEIDLTSLGITVAAGQGLRVALTFQHTGLPGIARDDGLTPNRNLIYTGGTWGRSETYGVLGDWIIRVVIETD